MGQVSITVVTTTFRPWDRLLGQLSDLKQQTLCPPFEWIVVDDLKDAREFKLEASFPILHIPPHRGVVDYFAPAHADNTALLHAQGELVYFMNDYIRLGADVLRQHWDAYKHFGPKAFFAGQLLPMDGEIHFPRRVAEAQLLAGSNAEALGLQSQAVWMYSAGRNDSAPLAELLAINGLDETFDGDRGGSDVDLAQRLMMNGCRYFILNNCYALEYAHHADKNPNYPWEKQLPQKGTWDRIARGYQPMKARAEHKWNIASERELIATLP